jgi:AmmeMemoRadiSam system protein B
VYLWDELRVSKEPQRLTLAEFTWIQLFDGEHDVRGIQAEVMRQHDGVLVPIDRFQALAERLDEALFLDGPRFREHLNNPIREPSCLGCYPAEADQLRHHLTKLFTEKAGSGLPVQKKPDGKLRAALLPHIDYQRGGSTYTWGFKEVFERTDASLFVIIGTSHYSTNRFTLTRQNFKTPLGVVATDQEYVNRLEAHYGPGLFDDPLAHVPEHSIELEVVFLQYLYEGRRPIRIVPLLVGSFQDAVESRKQPRQSADIARMIAALRRAEAETKEPICYIISGDLAHIGPKFGDAKPVTAALAASSHRKDQEILYRAEEAGADAYFDLIAEENDQRRICGLPPTYTVLEAALPKSGKLLRYDQYVHPRGFESVSFASMTFYQ